MSRIPEDAYDNQQDQPDVQDRDEDAAAQRVQQDEIEEALRKRPQFPDIKPPTGR